MQHISMLNPEAGLQAAKISFASKIPSKILRIDPYKSVLEVKKRVCNPNFERISINAVAARCRASVWG